MSTSSGTIHYQLAAPDDLSRLLGDLPDVEAGTLVIAFDVADPSFPTDLHLARLVSAGRDSQKRLVIETADPDLAERAIMLGFNDSAVARDAPASALADTRSIEPVILARIDDRSATRGFDTTANLATYAPANAQAASNQAASHRHAAGHTGTFHRVDANWTSPARPGQAAVSAGAGLSEAPTTSINPSRPGAWESAADEESAATTNPQERGTSRTRKPASRRRRRLLLAAAVIAPVFVFLVVGALAVFLLPTADVRIVPEEEAVASSLTYGLAIDDAEYDVTMEPTTITNTTRAEATREASGERFEPDGTASGTIQITNPLTSEVTVPAGTEISGGNGVAYYTAEDLRIEAADPFGSMSFGSGSVGVYAGIAGPDGNLEAGSLTGQLGSGLFYTNPSAISGGTMRSIAVIEEADIEAVRSEVEQDLRNRAESEFMSTVSSGDELVPGSLEIGEPEIEVEGEAGQDGESVSATGSLTVRAQVYSPEELHQMAGEEADRLLTRQGQSDRILLAETVNMREPQSINGDDTAFRIEVEATARKVISEAERNQITEQLVGLSRDDAEALLEQHPKIEQFNVQIEPDWLPDRMPEILSRIELSVESREQTTATR